MSGHQRACGYLFCVGSCRIKFTEIKINLMLSDHEDCQNKCPMKTHHFIHYNVSESIVLIQSRYFYEGLRNSCISLQLVCIYLVKFTSCLSGKGFLSRLDAEAFCRITSGSQLSTCTLEKLQIIVLITFCFAFGLHSVLSYFPTLIFLQFISFCDIINLSL